MLVYTCISTYICVYNAYFYIVVACSFPTVHWLSLLPLGHSTEDAYVPLTLELQSKRPGRPAPLK